MPPIKPLRKFNCAIAELYAICRICWLSCKENLAAFTALKTFYDIPYVDAALAEIDAAANMPGEKERDLLHSAKHIDLQQAGADCLNSWRYLRTYIRSAFTEEYVDINIAAAGGNYYATAMEENWEDMLLMMNTGKVFITNNLAILTGAGMPATFQADYNTDFDKLTGCYNAFKDAQQDAEAGTIQKMNANNGIYDRVQAMNLDGQAIFEDNAELYDRFVFARVKELVSPTNGIPSTTLILHGTVKNSGTQQPMIHVPITLTLPGAQPITIQTVEFGRYVFEQTHLQPGTIYPHMKIEVPGFEVFEKDLELTIGHKYEESVVLVPAQSMLKAA